MEVVGEAADGREAARRADYGYLAEMLRAGASGYVLKQSSSRDLLSAVRAVASGRNYLDPAVTSHVVRNLSREQPGAKKASPSVGGRRRCCA